MGWKEQRIKNWNRRSKRLRTVHSKINGKDFILYPTTRYHRFYIKQQLRI